MEEWQKDIISRNLPNLLTNTISNNSLLATLLKSNVITLNEVDYLTRLPNNETQVLNLYSIAMTRDDGFDKLIEGLYDTNQSGAVSIIRTECVKRETEGLDDIISVSCDRKIILGKGSQGTVVYKGKFGTRDVAVKRIPITALDDQDSQAIVNEVKILKAIDEHENIVRYFGSKRAQDSILIVLELCDMTLKNWIAEKNIQISPLEILKQVTVGMEWLHSKNIVHRDLKPDNIVLNRNLRKFKISDFGMSRLIGKEKSYVSSVGIGTLGWVAPEVLSQTLGDAPSQIQFTFASDVFSLGCVYYYVMSDGKPPFGDHLRCSANILAGTLAIDRNDILYGVPQNISIMEKMISNDPASRPTCQSLASSHAFWSDDPLEDLIDTNIGMVDVKDNRLVCRFTTHDVTMGRLNSDGFP